MIQLYFSHVITLDDVFETYSVGGNLRVRVALKEHAIKSLFEGRIFYTVFENKKVYYGISNGEEHLITNIRSIINVSSVHKLISEFLNYQYTCVNSNISFHEYRESLYKSSFKGISLKKATSYIIERKPSEMLLWKIRHYYDNNLFDKMMCDLLEKDLNENGFKIAIDKTGRTFEKDGKVYYKNIGSTSYILFCKLRNVEMFDCRIADYTEAYQIGKTKAMCIYPKAGFDLYEKCFIPDFKPYIHYPLLSGVIDDYNKYEKFDIIQTSEEREFTNKLKELIS